MLKITQLYRNIIRNEFARQAFIIYVGTGAVHVANLLFQLLVIRRFSPSEYANFAALTSIFYLVGAPATVLTLASSKFAAEHKASGELHRTKALMNFLLPRLALVSAALAVIYLAMVPLISGFFAVPPLATALLAPLIVFTFLTPVQRGILQGIDRFFHLVITNIAEAAAKLALGFIVIALGLGLKGAISSFTAAALVGFGLGIYFLRRDLPSKDETEKFTPRSLYSIGRTVIPIALASVGFTLVTYSDVAFVKSFASEGVASQYAALSLFGRLVLFLASPIALVMFPKIVAHKDEPKVRRRYLLMTTGFVGLITTFIFAIYQFAPQIAIKGLFFGSKNLQAYQELAPYMGIIALSAGAMTLSTVIGQYFLARGKSAFITLLFVDALVAIEGLYLYHNGIGQIAYVLLTANVLLLVGMLVVLGINERSSNAQN